MAIQTLKYQHLLGTAWMVDTAADGPPWPILIFNTMTQTWEPIGKAGIEMQWRGVFVPVGSYYVGDVVRLASKVYICKATPSPVLDTRVDTFVRADQAEWGTASDGNVWNNISPYTAGLDSISSNKGLATSDSSSHANSKVLGAAFAGSEVDLSVRWNCTTSVGSDDGITMFLGVDDSLSGSIVNVLLNGAVFINLVGSSGYSNSTGWSGGTAGTAYHTRCQIQEDTVRTRTWTDGTAEPSTWDVEWVSGVTILPGKIGLANVDDNPSTTLAFDAFDAHMLHAAIPYPTVDSAHWDLVAG